MIITKKFKYLLFFLFFLTACESLQKGLGVKKDIPDEFLIKKIDPIEMPPNYELIPPGTKKDKKSLEKSESKNIKNILDSELKTKENISKDQNTEKKISDKIENEVLKKLND